MFGGVWRPRVDVPEFSRCCFCLPLRYGLITWGYLKLIGLSFVAYSLFSHIKIIKALDIEVPTVVIFLATIVIMDLICNVIIVAAGHMKHRLLYKVYYYYSIFFVVTFTLGSIINTITDVLEFRDSRTKADAGFFIMYVVSYLYASLPIIVVQIYVTLLVRTEILKLDNNSDLQFVNNGAESMGLGETAKETP